jgi:hypothetical protein
MIMDAGPHEGAKAMPMQTATGGRAPLPSVSIFGGTLQKRVEQ